MNNEQFRELCENVLVPQIVGAIERHLVDIHDMLDVSASELVRVGDRIDEIHAQLCRDTDK